MEKTTGFEPVPPGLPGARPLSFILDPSFAERETAERPAPAGSEIRTQGVPKERGRIKVEQGGKMAALNRCGDLIEDCKGVDAAAVLFRRLRHRRTFLLDAVDQYRDDSGGNDEAERDDRGDGEQQVESAATVQQRDQ
jgi:hypothetical protein